MPSTTTAACIVFSFAFVVREARCLESAASIKEAMCAEYRAYKADSGEGHQSWEYTLPVYWECDYPACGGRQQTPIDIHDAYAVSPEAEEHARRLDEAKTLYTLMESVTFDGFVHNTGHGLQVTHCLGTFTYPSGEMYNGLQFHIHCPSEHALEGELKACELHMVHQKIGSTGTENLLVVGVLFELGDVDSAFLQKMGLPNGAPEDAATLAAISDVNCKRDFESALKGDFYHYVGSLTTPPCSETVLWFVLKSLLTVSQRQIDAFHNLPGLALPANNRPLQAFNARQLYRNHFSGCYAEGKEYGHTWNYILPRCWPSLGYALCAGLNQSPMHIDTGALTSVGSGDETLSEATNYEAVSGAETHNTGHSLQINAPGGSFGTFLYGSDFYEALQCHTHVPSEHTIDGQLHACELHIVHQKRGSTGTDNLLVIGIMFNKGAPSSLLEKMGLPTGAPTDGEVKYAFQGDLDMGVEFSTPLAGHYFRYDGSLTTPPCSETVKWFVTAVALTISQEQLNKHHSIFKQPALDRPAQLRNGRALVKDILEPGMLPVDEDQFGCAGEGYTPSLQPVSVRRLAGGSAWTYLFANCWEESYPQCGGRQQSPVDIKVDGPFVGQGSEAMNLLVLTTYVDVEDCRMRNTGHGLQAESATDLTFGTLEMDGLTYNALQYHIHCPSEHTLDGAVYSCEVHAVHQAVSATGLENLLVFGVLYEIGTVSDIFIDNFVKGVDLEEDATMALDETISLRDFHQLRRGFYRYDGSLTTPPCAESVKWFVLRLSATMTQAHADLLLTAMQHPNLNNRPIQPHHGRGIWKDALPGCYFPSPSSASRRLTAAPWDYLMPQCWAPDYPNCAGTLQSPIDIRTEFITTKGTDTIYLEHGRWTGPPYRNTGHGFQVDYNVGYLNFKGSTYYTLQFHLHTPSEHAVDGELVAAELHAVHQLQGATGLNDLLVCGVMYKLGAASLWLDYVFPVFGGSSTQSITIHLDDELHPASVNGFYAYPGSLTTPPCDETVQWVVFKRHMTVSQSQIDSFHALFPMPQSNRPLQPYFGRRVVEDFFEEDSTEPVANGTCFPSEATVIARGLSHVPLIQVLQGSEVLVQMPSGEAAFQTVLGFIHDVSREESPKTRIVVVEHAGGVLRATPEHLVYKLADGVPESGAIAALEIGDHVMLGSSRGGSLVLAVHADVATNGVRALLTAAGTTIIDGTCASTYADLHAAVLPHGFAHSLFFLVRVFAQTRPFMRVLPLAGTHLRQGAFWSTTSA
eukprot:TRINITY_DN5113_c0_g1_i1.p1 TRINITY_DN5113_c0_g1~~TRINITY_DN5113_c0_g1_i1.p1  ORF type:complete len:1277 (+),score=203.92 TRINITY_DN5113_c0_g1_i1:69-3833(+)